MTALDFREKEAGLPDAVRRRRLNRKSRDSVQNAPPQVPRLNFMELGLPSHKKT